MGGWGVGGGGAEKKKSKAKRRKGREELRREATGDRVRQTSYKNTKREEEGRIRKERINNNRKEKWKGIKSDQKDSS